MMIFVPISIKFIFVKTFQHRGLNIQFTGSGMEIQQEVLIQLKRNQMRKIKNLKTWPKIQMRNGSIILNLEYL
jgi:hypothetical protein